MSRWRVGVVFVLAALPFVFLIGVGLYALWERDLAFAAWFPMAACWALAYLLAWYWQRHHGLLRPLDPTPPLTWTERDRQAWHLVETRARTAAQLDPNQLSDPNFYVTTGRELAFELARFYHPRASDPLGSLTLPEILAVIELAAHDLAELVDRYVPGGHLLTVKHWRQAKTAVDWYPAASKLYWLVSALFSPMRTGLRYVATQIGLSGPWQMLQQDLLVWFYTAYLHRLGTYLIDLNSGRLRIGARRYRELVLRQESEEDRATSVSDGVRQVTIAVLGQVKAGKSSLINALLGEQRAHTDVIPATAEITRYELQPEGVPTRLVLLDTVGYGHAGPKEDQVRATQEAAQQADLLLFVMHARNPARQADVAMLNALESWFKARPELKRPPLLAALTHIDLLSPSLEWAPPYDWQQPVRPKEQQIRQALEVAREQLGDRAAALVPVCTAAGKIHGVEEGLLPAIVNLVPEAQAVGLLRCLRAEADAGKARRILQQLLAAGKQAAKVLWQSVRQG